MKRALWWSGAGLLLIAAVAVFLLNSAWLQDAARARVIAVLEQASGGPVTIGDFHFDWRMLAVVCRNVRAQNASAQRIDVKLRWRSLLEETLDVKQIDVDRPEIDFDTAQAKRMPLGAAFAIRVGHYRVMNGILHLHAKTQGFELRGEDLSADFERRSAREEYQFQAASRRIAIESDCWGPLEADFAAKGRLKPGVLWIDKWTAHAERKAGGALTLDGQGSYRNAAGFEARGTIQGSMRDASGQGHFRYQAGEMTLSDLALKLFGGSFAGQAQAALDRSWSFSGKLQGVDVREASRALGRPLPWSARADGTLAGTSKDGLRGELRFTGALAGDVQFRATRPTAVTFGPSELRLAHTDLGFSGSEASGFALQLDTTDTNEVKAALRLARRGPHIADIAVLQPGGRAHFAGSVRFEKGQPVITGALRIDQFRAYQRDWEQLDFQGEAAQNRVHADHLELTGAEAHISGAGDLRLQNWQPADSSQLNLHGTFSLAHVDVALPVSGAATGRADIHGTLVRPAGTATLHLENGQLYGERIKALRAEIAFEGRDVHASHGVLQDSAGDTLAFSGSYLGQRLDLRLATRGFVLSHVNGMSGLDGKVALDASVAAEVAGRDVRPIAVSGKVELTNAGFAGKALGSAVARMKTSAGRVQFELSGDLHGGRFTGSAAVGLGEGNPVEGTIRCELLELNNFLPSEIPAKVEAAGEVKFAGKLLEWRKWTVDARAESLQIAATAFPFTLRNAAPADLAFGDGRLTVRQLDLAGPDTTLHVTGGASRNALNLTVDGALSLQIARLLDANVDTAQGEALVHATARGTLENPQLAGRLQIKDGALGLRDFADELTKLNGSVVFDQNRATIQTLTAEAGGGKLALTGFVTFGGAAPVAYHLESHAESTRLRYANGISVTANANLRLTGTSSSSLLSGTTRITRIVLNPNADLGNLLTSLGVFAPTPANQKAFASSLQFDVGIESAPSLQISTSLSRDVEAAIDLRLRGTPERPVLLGTVTANQGDIRVFGGRYTINRGEVTFQNASHIEPVLDLDLQTQARGINVDITISGTFNHLNISYRSDPPLQPRDIIALLTVGRTPQEAANVQTSQVTGNTSVLEANPGSVLGQAIAPPSGRLSKLFGITNIKLDPLVQGLTNTPQSRLTVEQQISRQITVTYVTNLEQTSEQIFRFEWAFSQQYSIVAVRDDNGEFGIDFQYRKRFK